MATEVKAGGKSVSVPTMDEFSALEVRVTSLEGRVGALEGGTTPPEPIDPPEPIIPPEPITDGIQAKRIADLIESLGVNTFSSLDSNNTWGSWPADYSPASVIAALKYILGDSGFQLGVREYHYGSRYNMQKQWFPQLVAAFPDMRNIICPGANMPPNDVGTMLQLAHDPANRIFAAEGLCEPNTDFGSGQVPVGTTMDIQTRVWNGKKSLTVYGPSVVAGMPHPEGWITGYFGNQMDAVNAMMDIGNGHYYPPHAPDVPNTGSSIDEWTGGLWTAYGHHDIGETEFHPTLYAAATAAGVSPTSAIKQRIAVLAGALRGSEPPIPVLTANNSRDPFFTLQMLLKCAKNGTRGVWWYALYDYGSTYQCGLFPKDASNPRPTADALKALCAICADRGDRRGFSPGKLDITVAGLTEAMNFDVYQASNGRFLVLIWHAAQDVNQGVAVQVNIGFGTSKREVNVFDPLTSTAEVSNSANVREVTLTLPPGVTVLEVEP